MINTVKSFLFAFLLAGISSCKHSVPDLVPGPKIIAPPPDQRAKYVMPLAVGNMWNYTIVSTSYLKLHKSTTPVTEPFDSFPYNTYSTGYLVWQITDRCFLNNLPAYVLQETPGSKFILCNEGGRVLRVSYTNVRWKNSTKAVLKDGVPVDTMFDFHTTDRNLGNGKLLHYEHTNPYMKSITWSVTPNHSYQQATWDKHTYTDNIGLTEASSGSYYVVKAPSWVYVSDQGDELKTILTSYSLH